MAETRKSITIPLIVAAAAAIALVFAFVGTNGSDTTSPTAGDRSSSGSDSDDSLERRQVDDPLAKGDVDAPVVLVAYSEFQCPFCGKFARDTAPILEQKYVADGTLRIEWRDFPFLGPESTTAAVAGRAAAAQGKFWEFHDAMYADPLPPNSGNLDQAYVESMARSVDIDIEKFRQVMSDPETSTAVQAEFEAGRSAGVTSTPSFFINGTPVIGAQPAEVFEQVIEEAAEAAQGR